LLVELDTSPPLEDDVSMKRNSSEACQSAADPADVLAHFCILDETLRAARWQVVERFLATALDRQALPDGVRITFARHGQTARDIVEFIQLERACCARFAYSFEDGPGDLLSLLIRASAADLPALQALYLRPRPQ
jgi:hypothetical protein